MAVRRTIFFLCDRDSMLGMKLRFTIRDLLWLIIVIAIGSRWIIERSNASRDRQKAQEELADYRQALNQVEEQLYRQPQTTNPSAPRYGK